MNKLTEAVLHTAGLEPYKKFQLAMAGARNQLDHARLCNTTASAAICVSDAAEFYEHAAVQLNALAAALKQAVKEAQA